MKKINEYVPHKVYANLLKFLEYRELDLVSGHVVVGRMAKGEKKSSSGWLKEDDFNQHIQLDGYVIVEARDSANKIRRYPKAVPEVARGMPTRTFIVLIEPGSNYSTASANFVKLLGRIPDFSSKKRKHNVEILVITKILMKSNIHNKIAAYITPGRVEGGDAKDVKTNSSSQNLPAKASQEGAGFLFIHNYPYKTFTSVIPEHILVSPHRLVPKEEALKILQEVHAEKKELPKVRQSGPMMIWLGGSVGDLVETMSRSEDTGVERKYMVVIPSV